MHSPRRSVTSLKGMEAARNAGKPAPEISPSVPEAITTIHEAGGVAVWAHPFWDVSDPELVLDAIDRFRASGLDGVESFYLTHTEEQTVLLVDRCADPCACGQGRREDAARRAAGGGGEVGDPLEHAEAQREEPSRVRTAELEASGGHRSTSECRLKTGSRRVSRVRS